MENSWAQISYKMGVQRNGLFSAMNGRNNTNQRFNKEYLGIKTPQIYYNITRLCTSIDAWNTPINFTCIIYYFSSCMLLESSITWSTCLFLLLSHQSDLYLLRNAFSAQTTNKSSEIIHHHSSSKETLFFHCHYLCLWTQYIACNKHLNKPLNYSHTNKKN